jgi:hypothetical protein
MYDYDNICKILRLWPMLRMLGNPKKVKDQFFFVFKSTYPYFFLLWSCYKKKKKQEESCWNLKSLCTPSQLEIVLKLLWASNTCHDSKSFEWVLFYKLKKNILQTFPKPGIWMFELNFPKRKEKKNSVSYCWIKTSFSPHQDFRIEILRRLHEGKTSPFSSSKTCGINWSTEQRLKNQPFNGLIFAIRL